MVALNLEIPEVTSNNNPWAETSDVSSIIWAPLKEIGFHAGEQKLGENPEEILRYCANQEYAGFLDVGHAKRLVLNFTGFLPHHAFSSYRIMQNTYTANEIPFCAVYPNFPSVQALSTNDLPDPSAAYDQHIENLARIIDVCSQRAEELIILTTSLGGTFAIDALRKLQGRPEKRIPDLNKLERIKHIFFLNAPLSREEFSLPQGSLAEMERYINHTFYTENSLYPQTEELQLLLFDWLAKFMATNNHNNDRDILLPETTGITYMSTSLKEENGSIVPLPGVDQIMHAVLDKNVRCSTVIFDGVNPMLRLLPSSNVKWIPAQPSQNPQAPLSRGHYLDGKEIYKLREVLRPIITS